MNKRQYDQYCPVAGALDIIGERWAMLVVRELLSGPKRFADLEAGLPGIGTNTLTTRLGDLETGGVILKRRLPAPAAATVYALTAWGEELGPILYAIARWSAPRLLGGDFRYPLQATWLATALQAFFRRDGVKGVTATVGLVLPSGTLTLAFKRGAFSATAGEPAAPDLTIVTSEQGFVGLLSGGSTATAARQGMAMTGDVGLVDTLVAAFPLGG